MKPRDISHIVRRILVWALRGSLVAALLACLLAVGWLLSIRAEAQAAVARGDFYIEAVCVDPARPSLLFDCSCGWPAPPCPAQTWVPLDCFAEAEAHRTDGDPWAGCEFYHPEEE